MFNKLFKHLFVYSYILGLIFVWIPGINAQTKSFLYESNTSNETTQNLEDIGCPVIEYIKVQDTEQGSLILSWKVNSAQTVEIVGVATDLPSVGEYTLGDIPEQLEIKAQNDVCSVSKTLAFETKDKVVKQTVAVGAAGITLGVIIDFLSKLFMQLRGGVLPLLAMLPLGRRKNNIIGVVLTEENEPVEDAVVGVWLKTDEGYKPYLTDITDADGRFAFKLPENSQVVLGVYAKGYRFMRNIDSKDIKNLVLDDLSLYKGEVLTIKEGTVYKLVMLLQESEVEDQRIEYVENVTKRAGRSLKDVLIWILWFVGLVYTGFTASLLGWPLKLIVLLSVYAGVLGYKLYMMIKPSKALRRTAALLGLSKFGGPIHQD